MVNTPVSGQEESGGSKVVLCAVAEEMAKLTLSTLSAEGEVEGEEEESKGRKNLLRPCRSCAKTVWLSKFDSCYTCEVCCKGGIEKKCMKGSDSVNSLGACGL